MFNAIAEILGDYKESAINLVANWKQRLTSFDEFRSYIAAEWQKALWILIYVAINIGLFIEAFVRKLLSNSQKTCIFNPKRLFFQTNFKIAITTQPIGYAQILNGTYGFVWVARGFGQLLNFNCALVILPVCRSLLTTLRRLKFGFIIPFDKNIQFHRYISYNVAIFSILHGYVFLQGNFPLLKILLNFFLNHLVFFYIVLTLSLAHYGNYSCCYFLYKEARTVTTVYTPTQASWATISGLTGNILGVVMVLMYAAATKSYRASSNFTIFWYTHQLFVIFYIALLLHGKNFWMWFLVCVFLFFSNVSKKLLLIFF